MAPPLEELQVRAGSYRLCSNRLNGEAPCADLSLQVPLTQRWSSQGIIQKLHEELEPFTSASVRTINAEV